ncbi:hypothetical protein XENTR_v10023938 [Xenopus tropicalis]|nr:hypothetical protein XENTR_v10023938 [Xenopus tropicalis]
MEDAVGAKSLTSEEKEKIKERLCLLKKEYKRTFNRLRRSQRAERVKTHVQKTIAEQNHLLSQEGAGPGNRGSQSSIASNDADLQSKSTRPDTERKPCVTFNFEPEILCAEGSSPCCSVSGSSGQELDGTEKPQDMGQAFDTTIQRSRLKLRRSTKRRCSADQSLSDGSLFSDTLKDTDGLQGKVMDRSDCGLPVFKKSAKHPMDQNHVNLHDFSVGPDFGTENLNTAALDTGNITDFLGGNVDASPVTREQCLDNKIQVKSGFTEVTIGKMQEPPMTPGLENIKEPLLSPCLGKIRKSSLLLCTDKPREPSLSPNTEKTRTPPLCLSPNIDKTTSPLRSRQKDKTEPPPADIETSRELSLSSYMEQNNTLAQKDQTSCDLGLTLQQGHTHSTPHIPTPLCSDEQNLLNQINNVQDTTTNTGEDNNPLNSCTLVEGLLFPVEYYVRTTRRMSNCQRKVDLDAIIHSQLGTSRRGSRGKPRSRRVSGEEGSIYTSPSPMACFASEFISNALCLTPLSHQTPNSNKHGANRGRRGRGRYSSPKLELPQVSSSHDVRKRSSLLEPDAVASPISNGSQSEKENCEEQTTPRLDPHSAHLFAPYRTEQPHVTEGLNSEQIYILPNSDQKSKYNLRSRNSASLFHYSLPDDMDDFDNGSINQNKLKRSIEFTDNQKSERQRSCLTPSSPFPALSSRMSLEKLLSCLEIKDFHLPDDDFGFLKLQKLKSLSQLEPFVPLPTTETGRTKPDNTTLPGTDYSTAFQATIDSSVLAIKPSACTLYNGKSNAAPPDKTASKAILCVEIPNAPSQEHVAYSAHSVELPPPVSQVRKSQETVLNHLQKRSDDIRPCEVDVKPTGNESVPHASPLPSKLRLVCSSGLGPNQEVEILQLSEKGRTMRSHTLQPPEASILSFSEVEGEADAVVGSTVDNKVVIWNGATGQLLSTINVGELCGDSACLSAYSDSGLLFLLLASPYSNSLEAARKCIFTLIAANPKSERCAHVMSYTLPEGQDGRYLEGDIISHNAAAVLTSGSVAFWDLPRSHCSALLITNVDIHWSLVRWTHSMSQVLAGQKNGTIYIYSYTGLAPKEKIKEFEKNGIS